MWLLLFWAVVGGAYVWSLRHFRASKAEEVLAKFRLPIEQVGKPRDEPKPVDPWEYTRKLLGPDWKPPD